MILGRQESADFSVANTIDSPNFFNLIGGFMSRSWGNKDKEYVKKYNQEWYRNNKAKRLKQVQEWRKNNPEKFKAMPSRSPEHIKKQQLKKRHGITLEQFNQMLVAQDGKCAICHMGFKDNKDTCVDHNHKTGQIRQLLCFNCNVGIGKFDDSVRLLQNAVDYLEKWS